MENKTYFVSSDIHGFYTEWMASLKEAGFDKYNDNHILIVCGDIFDRGEEPWKIYKFLTSFPDERVVLIKGNHEHLLCELVNRKEPCGYDYHNRTYDTIISLYKNPADVMLRWIKENEDKYDDDMLFRQEAFKVYGKAQAKLYSNAKIKQIVAWINSPRWLNYYELGKYIFVHSFIPLRENIDRTKLYYRDWRKESSSVLWEEATWGCPYRLYLAGYFEEEEANGKVLVCGHWHTADFYNELLYKNEPEKQFSVYEKNPIFKADKYPGLIGLDTCTVMTRKVNVLLIKEEDI